MDFLNQIWAAWNEQWGATTATILSIIAIALNAGDKTQRLASAITRWKGWSIARRWYLFVQKKYRIHRAKNVIFAHLEQTNVTIPIRTYSSCLTENRLTSGRNALSPITPERPSWLNDYFVATALEELRNDRKIGRAELYRLSNTWPANIEIYLFLRRRPGKTIEEQVEEEEVESRCRVEQFPPWRPQSSCLEESRYDTVEHAETTGPGATSFRSQVTRKPSAPPCSRCWVRAERERDIPMLVDSITKYDLAQIATIEICGRNQEFQEAVAAVIIESDCAADASTVREIVGQAITLRRNQLNTIPREDKEEWTEELTTDFKSKLTTLIGAKPE